MKQAVENGSIKGIRLNRSCPMLSHLLFAYDSIFFMNGSILECQNLAMILNQYCLGAGHEINLNKSSIFFSKGCPQSLKENMARELRVPIIDKTGKYLGISSDWDKSKKQMFAWVLGRISSKLESWKEKLLSKARK